MTESEILMVVAMAMTILDDYTVEYPAIDWLYNTRFVMSYLILPMFESFEVK